MYYQYVFRLSDVFIEAGVDSLLSRLFSDSVHCAAKVIYDGGIRNPNIAVIPKEPDRLWERPLMLFNRQQSHVSSVFC